MRLAVLQLVCRSLLALQRTSTGISVRSNVGLHESLLKEYGEQGLFHRGNAQGTFGKRVSECCSARTRIVGVAVSLPDPASSLAERQ